MSAGLALEVVTAPEHPIRGGGTFSPTTSTLVMAPDSALLVDAPFMKDDVHRVIAAVEASGRTLQTVVVTHGHADHYFGAGMIAARFPGATVVSTETVCTDIADSVAVQKSMSKRLLEDPVVEPSQLPEPMRGDTIDLDGYEVKVTDVGQGDIAPSAIVHIPELRTVVAGDVVYNKIHHMLAFSTPAQWKRWIASIDYIEGLTPKVLVAGHKKPNAADDAVTSILDDSRRYIEDFAEAVQRAATASDVIDAMTRRYPDHGNPTTLVASASAALKTKATG